MSNEIPFDLEIPFSVFEKSNASPGKQRRIGGIVSLESADQQKERILQRGLDFSYFMRNGWFNDNHSRKTADILGYPEKVRLFKAGESLPNGDIASAPGHWVEGYLLDTPEADRIFQLGKALQKTNRRLGFSVEGKIMRKSGPDHKTIAQANVRNVAITNCPVHDGTKLEILAKSLEAVEASESEDTRINKTLGMGTATSTGAPEGPQTGMGAGQVITPESLEKENKKKKKKKGAKSKNIKKSLTCEEIREMVKSRFPNMNDDQIQKFIDLAKRQKASGKL